MSWSGPRLLRTVAPVAACALLLGACASRSSGTGGASPSPGDGLVLRVETAGGFVGFDVRFRQMPEFSLLADGTAVTVGPQIEIYPGPALPGLIGRQVTDDGASKILDEARAAGLFGPDRTYTTMLISDAPTTTFTLIESGHRHVISVYALGYEAGSGEVRQDERDARAALDELRTKLLDLASWLPAQDIGPESAFEPSRLMIHWRQFPGPPEAQDMLKEPAKAWPLSTPLATFGTPAPDAPGMRCAVVGGADFHTLYPAARASNVLTPWESGGINYQILFRPLLPDEEGC